MRKIYIILWALIAVQAFVLYAVSRPNDVPPPVPVVVLPQKVVSPVPVTNDAYCSYHDCKG